VSLRRRQQRVLRGMERDLAASEPGLHAFFLSFNSRSGGTEMPPLEHVVSWPLRTLDRLWPGRNVTERAKDQCAENREDP
jgi:hypothetical protein